MHANESANILYFEGKPVASLLSIFENQGTWYSTYSLLSDIDPRLNAFINFSKTQLSSETWNEDALSTFDDIVGSLAWGVLGQDCNHQLDGCPLFDGDEMSWRRKE